MGMTEILPVSFRYYNSSAGRKRSPVIKRESFQLQCWAVSKRVNSSKEDADDRTLIAPTELQGLMKAS
jgi:hypothetical protein